VWQNADFYSDPVPQGERRMYATAKDSHTYVDSLRELLPAHSAAWQSGRA
jgi:hypothetical protein